MKRVIFLFFIPLMIFSCRDGERRIEKKVEKIHRRILTVDTHADTPVNLLKSGFDLGKLNERGCVDFPRMKEGGLDAEFFAVFIEQGPRNDTAYQFVKEKALRIFEAIHKNVSENQHLAEVAYSTDDAYRLKKKGKIAVFIGIENGYAIGKDIGMIKQYYDLGARYITLAHSMNNDISDSSTDSSGPEHNGLSGFGIEVVKEMNRMGMMVDVSHISDNSFFHVLEISEAPVIASHSSCRALCESPRNISDNMLCALKENGGVIQICLYSNYIKTPEPNPILEEKLNELSLKYGDFNTLAEDEKNLMKAEYKRIKDTYVKLATVKDVVDHIDHVVQVIGIDHVGIGTDFDGGGGVEGCMNVLEVKNITNELLRRGYSKNEIAKIWGGNIMRVLSEVEDIKSAKLTGN